MSKMELLANTIKYSIAQMDKILVTISRNISAPKIISILNHKQYQTLIVAIVYLMDKKWSYISLVYDAADSACH